MKLPFWILPREEKKSRISKVHQSKRLNLESLESRLVLTTTLPALAAISGAPNSTTISAYPAIDSFSTSSHSVSDGSGTTSAPTISEWTHTAAPGESIVVTGANFDEKTIFWVYGQTGSTTSPVQALVQNVNTTTGQAEITLPDSLTPNSMYQLWAQNNDDASAAVAINQTEAWWIEKARTTSDTTFTIHGQNLTYNTGDWTTSSGSDAPTYVYYRTAGSTGNYTQAAIVSANPYSVTFQLASGVSSPGDYEGWITNGHGGSFGWSKIPTEFTVDGTADTTGISVDSTTSATDDSSGTWDQKLITFGSGSSETDNGTHNSTVLENLFLNHSNRGDDTITVIDLPTGTFAISETVALTTTTAIGKNIKLVGHNTTIKWVGGDGDPMFATYNSIGLGNGIENYTFRNITFHNGSVLDTDPDDNSATHDGQYLGGGNVFRLGRGVVNVHFDGVTIWSPSALAFDISPQLPGGGDAFDGVYITGSTITAWQNVFVNGKHLFIDNTHFYATNDSWYCIYAQDVRESSITNNVGESYFAKDFRDNNSNADPDGSDVDTYRNLGAFWGRRFFWGGYLGGNVYLSGNDSRYLGIRITTTPVSTDYDLGSRGGVKQGSYDRNTGEQYAWDNPSSIGFQTEVTDYTVSSGIATLKVSNSSVTSIDSAFGGSGGSAYLTYGSGNFSFYATVVSGVGSGQIRRIVGYSSGSPDASFVLESPFQVGLSTSGADQSVVVITPLFENVIMYKNEITGIPGNREKISAVEGDFGIYLYGQTYGFVVDGNTIKELRWSIALNGVAGSPSNNSFQFAGIAANNLIVNNQISDTRKGIVVEVQNSADVTDPPEGRLLGVFGNVIRDNTFKNVNEAGVTFMYNRSNVSWVANEEISANIFERNYFSLAIASGDTISSPASPIGINYNLEYAPGQSSATNYPPVTDILFRENIINYLGGSSATGLKIGYGEVAVPDSSDGDGNNNAQRLPQEAILANNQLSGFSTPYTYASPATASVLPWDGELLVLPTTGTYSYQAVFRQKNGKYVSGGTSFTFEVDSNGNGSFDDGGSVTSNSQEVDLNLSSLVAGARFRVTNAVSGTSVIYTLSNTTNELGIFYFGSSEGDSATFLETTTGNVSVGIQSTTKSYNGITGRIIAYGGSGNDIIDGSGIDSLSIILVGEGDNDSITGGDGNDTITGGAGNDSIDGGAGDDSYLFTGSALGNDTLSDASGTDTLNFDGFASNATINLLTTSSQTVTSDLTLTLPSTIENVIGSGYNDTITGNSLANSISGGAGNDWISGDDGNDSILGGAGNDTVYGVGGLDTLLGEDGDDVLSGGDDVDFLAGGNGNDSVSGDDGNDYLFGDIINPSGISSPSGSGNDTLDGGAGDDVIAGGDGSDSILGGAGYDIIAGGHLILNLGIASFQTTGTDASDTIDGGDNDDIIFGGGGNDIIYGGNGNDGISGDEGGVSVFGVFQTSLLAGSGNDSILGGTGNDTIYGVGGNDTLEGGIGSDSLDGGANDDTNLFSGMALGNDTMADASGTDTLDFTGFASNANIDLSTTSAHTVSSDLTLTLPSTIENVIGSGYNDTITGNSLANSIIAGSGNDSILGGAGNDTIYGVIGLDTLLGEDGDDVLSGGDDVDFLAGGNGNDSVSGNDGNDYLFGDIINPSGISSPSGSGNDTLDGGAGDDVIAGGDGSDSILGGAGYDIIAGGHLILNLGIASFQTTGTDASDTIDGGDNDDIIFGGGGNDIIYGGNGNDGISGDEGGVSVLGVFQTSLLAGSGNDSILGGAGNDTVYGVGGNDVINGENDADSILGGDGSDFLIGGAGADNIDGSDGQDIIISGAINLTGGTFITFVNAVHAEWLSTNSYATRVANIQDGTGGSSHNGSNYLDGTAIDNDAAVDAVFGEDATPDNEDDWFLVDMTTDSTTDAVSGEEIDDIVTY